MAEKYFCEFCGTSESNVGKLVSGQCIRHPDGQWKGNHSLFEGDEKSQYTCKYCGTKSSSIEILTRSTCSSNQRGSAGCRRHIPARI